VAAILGIDPGYGRCGWAIVNDACSYINCGVIETSPLDDSQRLLQVYCSLKEIINTYHPISCGIEKLFFNKNVKTALSVAQVLGIIKLIMAQHNIPYAEYTPVQVKLSITGYGRASKNQLSTMIQKILKIPSLVIYDDAFDALAIALCHCLASSRYILINSNNQT